MTLSPQIKTTILAPVFPRASQTLAVQWTEGQDMEPWQAHCTRLLVQSDWDARHLPAAELALGDVRRISSAVPSPGGPLICADPVHFRADRDSAILVPGEMLQLTDLEADTLLESINDFLLADGLHVSRTETDRWFMSGRDGAALGSYPPSFLAHRNASAFLSDDDSSGSWRRLMTELQMLLHTHPVNLQRENIGRLPVNSVWFWGGASLQTSTVKARVSRQPVQLYAEDEYAVALARHLGIPCKPLDAYDPKSDHPHSLLVDTRLTHALFSENEQALVDAEQRILDEWIAPIQARIESGDALELEIFNEDGLQGKLDRHIASTAIATARADRVSGMQLTGRLNDRFVSGIGRFWKRLSRGR